jgi:hypothetical protein
MRIMKWLRGELLQSERRLRRAFHSKPEARLDDLTVRRGFRQGCRSARGAQLIDN